MATFVVLMAVGIMASLGVWQLDRLQWKKALLAQYERASRIGAPVEFPTGPREDAEKVYFRRSTINCDRVVGEPRLIGGHNARNELGYVHIVNCAVNDDAVVPVQIGWSKGPDKILWQGGAIAGTIAPYDDAPARLIASSPKGGLDASQIPSPDGIPNNHLSYAIQWFFFAATSLVIFLIALRARWKKS